MRSGRGVAPLFAVLLASALGAESLSGQNEFLVTQSRVFVNVTVIDGRGGAPRPESAVLVWGGRVRDIGSAGTMVLPQGTTVIDLEGSYMVPGFIDAHASPRTAEDLEALMLAGVTGVREGAMALDVFTERGREAFGDDPSPLVYIGGPVLDSGASAVGVALDSEAAAIAQVQAQVDAGAEFISVSPRVPSQWLVGIARAARTADAPLWTDRAADGWLLALRAGADVASRLVSGDPELLPEAEREPYRAAISTGGGATQAEWLRRLDPEGPGVQRAITALLSRDATVVPLLAAAHAPISCEGSDPGCNPPTEAESGELLDAWSKAEQLVRTLHGEGVRLVVGSDSPASTDWGIGFHREMRLLVEAGIPALEVLSMATRNAASALGQLHERGTIEIGKRADLVILHGDPTVDIRNARRISMVVIGGQPWRLRDDGGWERIGLD